MTTPPRHDTESGFDHADLDQFATATTEAFGHLQPLPCGQHSVTQLHRAKRHGKWFVLKSLCPLYSDQPACQAMLRKEFEIGFALAHPGIAATIALEQVDTLGTCIVEEWVDGCTLREFTASPEFTAQAARSVAVEVCHALAYLHARQVVHRDIKPSNILVTAIGHHAKLIDFGVSDTPSHAVLKGPAGTRRYAAPELLRGDQIDGRADLYALGVTLNEINQALPRPDARLARAARACTQADPDRRPAGATQVAEMLTRPVWRWPWTLAAAAFAITAVIAITTTRHASPAASAIAPDTATTRPTAPDTATVTVAPAPARQADAPATPSPSDERPAESPAPSSTPPEGAPTAGKPLPPMLRQLLLARAQQAGIGEAQELVDEIKQGPPMGDEAIRLAYSIRLDNAEHAAQLAVIEFYQHTDSNNLALRQYLVTPEGQQFLLTARQQARQAAERHLQQHLPDLMPAP